MVAAAPARTELSSGPRRRWHRGQALLGATRGFDQSLRFTPGRPDAGSAVRKQPAVTNRDKNDSIRARMADAGEPFNVARRKVEAAAAGPVSEAEFQEIKGTGRCDLRNRELTALPPEITQLTNLWELLLDGNQLTALPPEIGQLTNLQGLWLDGNRLNALPREVADLLSGGLELRLAGNPLPGPIFELYGQGPQALASYLRSLARP